MSKLQILTKGLIKENPTLVLVLGTCPSLAVTTSVQNAIGMGLATTFVLMMSNTIISMLKSLIPDKVRIPAFIVVIATFVSIVDLLIQGFVPALAESLGIFIPLIVVNCIVLGRAEAFASKNSVFDSFLDGIGMGLGFTIALFLIGTCRELLGSGSFWGYKLPFVTGDGILVFVLAPGAFIVMGFIIAIVKHFQKAKH
ncbi:MAG: electron transport complex subunit E [Bacteroidales bacterium]|nr:electron transport complex subunit E [Bacteroidales bacterium]